MARDIVFICHATPDDDDFVRWLGSRLTGHRYRVWADLLGLKGGSPFWVTIENVIREHAVKVLYVASRQSVSAAREGVRNELSVAATIKRSLNDPGFIIPLRLDDVPFADFPIQVHQLNGIDFHAGWGGKLLELLDTLESANVPTFPADGSTAFDAWRAEAVRSAAKVEETAELLTTDLLPIDALPGKIGFLSTLGDPVRSAAALKSIGVPASPFHQLIITFAFDAETRSSLRPDYSVSSRAVISFSDYLSGSHPDVTVPRRSEAEKIATALLRMQIELHLLERGLCRYETSSGDAFYFPIGLLSKNRVTYTAANGKSTYKAVVGKSERHQVFWHLGMKVDVKLTPDAYVRFRPYIVFSEDGIKALIDPKRTGQIRKRFCRNWWNPQWRQLQQAFTSFLGSGAESIEIKLGNGQILQLSPRLLTLTSGRRIAGDVVETEEPEEPPEPIDEEDEEIDDAFDDDSVTQEAA